MDPPLVAASGSIAGSGPAPGHARGRMASTLHNIEERVEEEIERDAEYVSDKTGLPTSVVIGLFFFIFLLIIGGVGFCAWRFLRKRRVTKDQLKKAQDEEGLVEGEEEPDFMEEEPLKVSGEVGQLDWWNIMWCL